jgi:hypothetical protein
MESSAPGLVYEDAFPSQIAGSSLMVLTAKRRRIARPLFVVDEMGFERGATVTLEADSLSPDELPVRNFRELKCFTIRAAVQVFICVRSYSS